MVYFGPSANGTAVARVMPDGTKLEKLEKLDLALAQDTGGLGVHRNTATPYTSLGFSGCAEDTAACGPDHEDGRGLMASVDFGGAEWLVMGGGRSAGDLDYICMVSADTNPLALRYVDLAAATGPQTKGFSALHGVGDRLYLAMPDTGGGRPFLLALLATPPAPGLETVRDIDLLNLKADDIPGMNTAGTAMIDSIGDFAARIYIANSGAWARSLIQLPLVAPADWKVITPTDASYAAKTSVVNTNVVDLVPTDRAVPQMATYRGRLYLARNTTDGPKIWMCNPALSEDLDHCDAGDWTLALANTAGDTQLSQFNNPANTSINMLVATSDHLYVS